MWWLLAGLLVVGWAVASQPPAGRWVRVGELAHFRYYELADYQNTPQALSRAQVSIALLRLEVFWELVAPQWSYSPDAKINYYKFASADNLVYGNTVFGRLPSATAYPMAGSFIAFLLDGLPTAPQQFKQFLELAANAHSQAELPAAFRRTFGLSLGTAEVRWHQFLDGWNEGDLQ